MPKYTKYDPASGEILAVLSCPEVDRGLHEPCLSGEYSSVEYKVVDGAAVRKDQAVVDEFLANRAWSDLRVLRDGYLQNSDWTQAPDAPVDQAAWATYRQALRDLPDNTTDPRNPTWPTKPN